LNCWIAKVLIIICVAFQISHAPFRKKYEGIEELLARIEELLACIEDLLARIEELLARIEDSLEGIEELLARIEELLEGIEAE